MSRIPSSRGSGIVLKEGAERWQEPEAVDNDKEALFSAYSRAVEAMNVQQ